MSDYNWFVKVSSKKNISPFGHCFRPADYCQEGDPARSLEEWNIINIVKLVREKPEWKRKYKDPEIVEKWKRELELVLQSTCYAEVWDYALKELAWTEYVERNFPNVESSGFHLGCDEKIVYSDIAVDEKIKERLKNSVKDFVAKEFKDGLDYHPGSNNQVVDIVHPSLYPLQYRKTPVFEDGKLELAKEVLSADFNKTFCWGISKDFQWLPAVMSMPRYGKKKLVFDSYINNLHPENAGLYGAIEDVFNAALPGVNLSLAMLKIRRRLRIEVPDELYGKEWIKMLEEYTNSMDAKGLDWEDFEEFEKENKPKYFEVPKPVYNFDTALDYSFSVKSFPFLKVIVKLANIELTPENPTYPGGSWHIEGCPNEDIVATVLYYYESANITESKLAFRTAFDEPDYEQNDSFAVKAVYGIEDESTMNKSIGKITCKEDRVVVFPNWYQHHVDSFGLADPSKPGSRKILCFFIVDPYNTSTITTATVPPQQPEWLEKEAIEEKKPVEPKKKAWFQKPKTKYDLLPKNWLSEVQKFGAPPIDLKSAKEVRAKLMDERKAADPEEEEFFERQFSLCEH